MVWLFGLSTLLLLTLTASTTVQQTTEEALVDRVGSRFTGDLDQRIDDGVIRVLVTYDQTDCFIDRGRQRGFEYELMRQLEKQLQDRASTDGDRRFTMAFEPIGE